MQTIRFRVQSVNYPSIPLEQPKDAKPFAPMVITVSSFSNHVWCLYSFVSMFFSLEALLV